jgi:hypothetical protein
MKERELYEKVINKGAHNGDVTIADPIAKKATLPNSNSNGEPMKKIEDPNNPGIEDTDMATNTKPTSASAASNKASVAMKEEDESVEQDDTEQETSYSIEVAFEGEELSEEFKEKATTIFEAAVNAKVSAEITKLDEHYAQQVQEQVESFKQELTEQLDKYLDYIVEQWMESNELAIEESLRSEITEEFIDGLRILFAEHYIEVPEDKLDVLEDLTNKVQELEQKLDESITTNIELNDAIKEYTKNEILAQVAEGLTLTQKEKFSTLAEGVEFTDTDNYAKKLEIVKENYFKSSTKTSKSITETEVELAEEVTPDKPVYHGTVAKYMQAISRTTTKK